LCLHCAHYCQPHLPARYSCIKLACRLTSHLRSCRLPLQFTFCNPVLLFTGYTSESSAIFVQCQCPQCAQHPCHARLRNLEQHVQHVTGDKVPPGNGNSICRNFLFLKTQPVQVRGAQSCPPVIVALRSNAVLAPSPLLAVKCLEPRIDSSGTFLKMYKQIVPAI
jgi:hypothetical protein